MSLFGILFNIGVGFGFAYFLYSYIKEVRRPKPKLKPTPRCQTCHKIMKEYGIVCDRECYSIFSDHAFRSLDTTEINSYLFIKDKEEIK